MNTPPSVIKRGAGPAVDRTYPCASLMPFTSAACYEWIFPTRSRSRFGRGSAISIFAAAVLIAAVSTPATAAGRPVKTRVLDNGLEVVVAEDRSVELVHVQVVFRHGATAETARTHGVSHLLEHMFFAAPVSKSSGTFLDAIRDLGVLHEARTGAERVLFAFTTPVNHLPALLALIREAVVNPTFDPQTLPIERKVVLDELDRQSDPESKVLAALASRIWKKAAHRTLPMGNRKTIERMTIEELRTAARRFYVPNNAALIVVGDVGADQVFTQTATLLAGWKRGADPLQEVARATPPSLERREVLVVPQSIPDVRGHLAWHAPPASATNPHSIVTPLLWLALDTNISPLQQKLTGAGLCREVRLRWGHARFLNTFMVTFTADPARVDDCVLGLLAEVERMALPGYVGDEDLRTAVRRFEVEGALQREHSEGLASELGAWWPMASIEFYLTLGERLARVTAADLAGFAKARLVDRPFVLAIAAAPALIATGIDRSHFERLLGSTLKKSARGVMTSEQPTPP